MLRGFAVFKGWSRAPPLQKRPGQPVGEGLCPSRNLLTPYCKTSYNIPKPARLNRGGTDVRHETLDLTSSDICACVRAPYLLRPVAQAETGPHTRGDRCPHGDAGADRSARTNAVPDAGTNCRGDPGRRYYRGRYRQLYGAPSRWRLYLPYRLPGRNNAAHCIRNTHRRAVSLLV